MDWLLLEPIVGYWKTLLRAEGDADPCIGESIVDLLVGLELSWVLRRETSPESLSCLRISIGLIFDFGSGLSSMQLEWMGSWFVFLKSSSMWRSLRHSCFSWPSFLFFDDSTLFLPDFANFASWSLVPADGPDAPCLSLSYLLVLVLPKPLDDPLMVMIVLRLLLPSPCPALMLALPFYVGEMNSESSVPSDLSFMNGLYSAPTSNPSES